MRDDADGVVVGAGEEDLGFVRGVEVWEIEDEGYACVVDWFILAQAVVVVDRVVPFLLLGFDEIPGNFPTENIDPELVVVAA